MGQDKMGGVPGFARGVLEKIRPYSPGKPIEEVKRELGIDDVIKLASNENPLGPSPKALEALLKCVPTVNIYPDGSGFLLKEALASFFGVSMGNVVLGCGADEIVRMLGEAFLNPGDEVVSAAGTFSQYEFASVLMDAHYVPVPLKDFTFDLEAIGRAISPRTKLVFICNPNNPTGTRVLPAKLDEFILSVPEGCLVVVDEAYIEYSDSPAEASALKHVLAGRNVMVLRTFSKIYGLAGLRVGYGIAREDITAAVERVRPPFNVNLLAQEAARAALSDDAHVARSIEVNRRGKAYLYSNFERLGLDYLPTQANFIFVNLRRDSRAVFGELLRRGVIVRTGDIFGFPEFIRVTIGTEEQNIRFIRALEEVLQQENSPSLENRSMENTRTGGRVIAIDGPAGAGKSTIAKNVAKRLGYRHISTGLLYRAIALKAILENVDISNEADLTRLARNADMHFALGADGDSRLLLDGVDVTDRLTSPEVDRLVSPVSRVPGVREALLDRQRALATGGGVVMDGRDIGTVVLPWADTKIFLTASLEERARRRFEQLRSQGHETSLEECRAAIALRDKIDSERECAPLVAAPDAVVLDTTGKGIEEVTGEVLSLVASRP